ncbi:hypothetical protein REPUB_Repub16aG0109900 [Reevesia pubescens]
MMRETEGLGIQRRQNDVISTVFVSHSPPRVHWRSLCNIFNHHGRVVDVFIPRKRSGMGHRFGFVRFGSKVEVVNAMRSLNGAWLLDFKLSVNMARFNPRAEFWRKVGSADKSDGLGTKTLLV